MLEKTVDLERMGGNVSLRVMYSLFEGKYLQATLISVSYSKTINLLVFNW